MVITARLEECQCQSVGGLLTWTTDNWQTAPDQSIRKDGLFIVFVKDALGFCWGVILPTLAFKSSWLICSEIHRRCNDCGKKNNFDVSVMKPCLVRKRREDELA